MQTVWTIPTIITLIVAIYGAILATINVIRNQRHLSVILEKVFPEDDLLPFVRVTIKNTGIINITINNVSIRLPDGHNITINSMLRPSNAHFPYELTAGKECLLGIDINEFIKILKNSVYYGKVKLVALVIDGTGKVHKSRKSFVFNLEEYDKQNES